MSITRYTGAGLKRAILSGNTPGWLVRHGKREYIEKVALSTPFWVDRKELNRLRDEARILTKATGILHVMAHIVPVTHPYVCGLMVPWNIKIVPWRVNIVEGNKWYPDQMELFDDSPSV